MELNKKKIINTSFGAQNQNVQTTAKYKQVYQSIKGNRNFHGKFTLISLPKNWFQQITYKNKEP